MDRRLRGSGQAKRRQIEELREHVAAELGQASWLADAGGSPTDQMSVPVKCERLEFWYPTR